MVEIRALHLISKLCETEREGERAGSKGAYFVSTTLLNSQTHEPHPYFLSAHARATSSGEMLATRSLHLTSKLCETEREGRWLALKGPILSRR